jgi:hypothetical protein
MFARYVVLNLKKQVTPALLPPWDDAGWDRMVRRDIDIRYVLSAGVVTWGEPGQPDVVCSGEGLFQRAVSSSRRTARKSRGDEDAAMLRELLSQPIPYIVLNLQGLGERPILVPAYDDVETTIARFQGPTERDVVSAGDVEFDLTGTGDPVCYGSAQLGDWMRPVQVNSRGREDAELIAAFYQESLLHC